MNYYDDSNYWLSVYTVYFNKSTRVISMNVMSLKRIMLQFFDATGLDVKKAMPL